MVLLPTPYTMTLLYTRPTTVGTTEYRQKLPGSLAKINHFFGMFVLQVFYFNNKESNSTYIFGYLT